MVSVFRSDGSLWYLLLAGQDPIFVGEGGTEMLWHGRRGLDVLFDLDSNKSLRAFRWILLVCHQLNQLETKSGAKV